MRALPRGQRYGFTVALVVAAAVPMLVWGEGAALLVAVAAASVVARKGPDVVAICAGTAVVATHYFGNPFGAPDFENGDAYLRVAFFAASASAIVALIRTQDRRSALDAATRAAAAIAENMPAMGWSTDAQGRYTYRNKAVWDYTGYVREEGSPSGEMRNWKQVQSLIHPDDEAGSARRWTECLESGAEFLIQHRVRRHDGIYRWFRAFARPARDQDGNIIAWYGSSVDIDDSKRAEEALQAAQDRLARASQAASLAELSASIAHEINQPLAAVIANSQACRQWLAADPPNLERAMFSAERVISNANSAAEVVSRIRALFRRSSEVRAVGSINDVVTEVCRLIGGEIEAKNIKVRVNLDKGVPPVVIDRVQIQQVVVNLLRNGMEAVEAAGDEAKVVEISSRCSGKDVVLVEVRDYGPGVTEPKRIFEPFYSTKKGGMGMGLSICRSIIEAHEGTIWATSAHTGGAVLSFTLPASTANPG